MIGNVGNFNAMKVYGLPKPIVAPPEQSREGKPEESILPVDQPEREKSPLQKLVDDTLSSFGGVGQGLDDLFGKMGMQNLAGSDTPVGGAMTAASYQFELNYQVVQAVSGATGQSAQSMSFSIEGSAAFMQALTGTENPQDAQKVASKDPMEMMRTFFSPENTARRILDFSLNFFKMSSFFEDGGDTEEARGGFADFIGKAIQKGFDEAMGILGSVPEETQQDIDKTHELVFDGLDDFVENGREIDPNSDAFVMAYSDWEFNLEMNYTSVQSYGPGGQPQHNVPDWAAGLLDVSA